jgi:hypothetical protein
MQLRPAARLPYLPEETESVGFGGYALFALLHLPLGYLLSLHPLFGTVHALLTLMVGLRIAVDPERPQALAAVLAYIAGFDVFWRMTDARVFHQFGKYAIVLLAGVWMLRAGRWRRTLGPIVYFALLLPSISVAPCGPATSSASCAVASPRPSRSWPSP